MNKDQVKGAAGKAQEKAVKPAGSTEQQPKGLHKQAKGQTPKAIGDVKEPAKGATHK